MRTIRTKIYFFKELTTEAQDIAIEENEFINVSDNWWFWTYEDAKLIDLEINSFDLDNRVISGKLLNDATSVSNKIIQNHGKDCETYLLAKTFLDVSNIFKGNEDNEKDFLRRLLECYISILQKEYDFLTSKEAIKETLISNEYEFLASGKMFK